MRILRTLAFGSTASRLQDAIAPVYAAFPTTRRLWMLVPHS